MNINPISNNQTELDLCDGTKVFFSYRTPVAACINGKYYRTSTKLSVTTSRHINSWLKGVAEIKDQNFFDYLIKK